MSNVPVSPLPDSAEPSLSDSAEPQSDADTYTVQPGDTLVSIARKLYGSEGAWSALERANRHVEGYDGFPASLERPGTVLITDLTPTGFMPLF